MKLDLHVHTRYSGNTDAELLPCLKQERIFTPAATNRDEFLAELHAGRVRVGGRHGNFFTMASDMLRLATGFYVDRVTRLAQSPLDWRRQAFVLAGIVGLPLVAVPLAGALGHFILEERFNRALLFDLVKRPAIRVPEVA